MNTAGVQGNASRGRGGRGGRGGRRGPWQNTGKRPFTRDQEHQLLDLFGDNIEGWYGSVRKRVVSKLTASMNVELAPPLFTEKQVWNKIAYLENRYKSVKDEMTASGFGCDDGDEPSVRSTIEKKFALFYEMDKIMGSRSNIQPAIVFDVGGFGASGGSELEVRYGQGAGGQDAGPQDVDEGSDEAEGGALSLLGSSASRGSDSPRPFPSGATVLQDGDPDDDEVDILAITGKRKSSGLKSAIQKRGKGAPAKKNSVGESLLEMSRVTAEQDATQHSEMIAVMRSELDLKRSETIARGRKGKAEELRKLAELYVSINDNDRALKIMEEARRLLQTDDPAAEA